MRYERDGYSVDGARKKGRALPQWYLDRPAEVDGADFYYEAYRDLQTDRRFEGGPIPHAEAVAYADRKGLTPDVADALWTVVRKMDIAERRWRYDELKAEAGVGISDLREN